MRHMHYGCSWLSDIRDVLCRRGMLFVSTSSECDVLKKVRIQEETLIDCVISVTCTGRQESCGSSKQCTFVSGSCMI